MGLRLGSTVVNCADLATMTRFWCDVLGLVPDSDDDGFRVLRGGRTNLSLQLAGTPVVARDQMHLDLYTDDLRAEVARVVALGATYVRADADDGGPFVVLTDPEGNPFCVCEVPGG